MVTRRESEVDAAYTCSLTPIKKTNTITTIDTAKTEYSPRQSLSNASPRGVKPGYSPFHERTLSSTASTAQEALESLTLSSSSYSVSTAKTSCSSCHDRIPSGSSVIDEGRILSSYRSALSECQAVSERNSQSPNTGRSKRRLNSR